MDKGCRQIVQCRNDTEGERLFALLFNQFLADLDLALGDNPGSRFFVKGKGRRDQKIAADHAADHDQKKGDNQEVLGTDLGQRRTFMLLFVITL